jgi:putative transposase
VGELCRLLEVSRGGYYAWTKRGISRQKQRNQELERQLVRLHEAYPALELDGLYHMVKQTIPCSRGRVHRLMKRLNIPSARKKAYKYTTNSKHSYPIASNLLERQFHFERPNQAWVGDITYIPNDKGWLYLAMVKDLCTRKIIGYAFSEHIDTKLTLEALNMAVHRERPQPGMIFHSDRGVQHASHHYRNRLEALGIRQSMSHKGGPYDNAVAENFFSCLKNELLHLRRFASRAQAHDDIIEYIEAFYNPLRPHSALGWLAPERFACRFDLAG